MRAHFCGEGWAKGRIACAGVVKAWSERGGSLGQVGGLRACDRTNQCLDTLRLSASLLRSNFCASRRRSNPVSRLLLTLEVTFVTVVFLPRIGFAPWVPALLVG